MSAPDFFTFCLQVNETINVGHGSDLTSGSSYGSLYWVGGIGDKVQAGNKDLTLEAAWLYAQYREGEVPATTNNEANALQLAIWDFQGEMAYASHSGSSYRFNYLTKSGYFRRDQRVQPVHGPPR